MTVQHAKLITEAGKIYHYKVLQTIYWNKDKNLSNKMYIRLLYIMTLATSSGMCVHQSGVHLPSNCPSLPALSILKLTQQWAALDMASTYTAAQDTRANTPLLSIILFN